MIDSLRKDKKAEKERKKQLASQQKNQSKRSGKPSQHASQEEESNIFYYELSMDNVLMRLKFPKFIEHTKKQFGDIVRIIECIMLTECRVK